MQIRKIDPAAAVAIVTVAAFMTGCATAPPSPTERIRARAQAVSTIIDDPERAAAAQAAFEGLHDAATKLEASVATARAGLLALHHDPTATPAAFRAAIDAMRERQEPMLLDLVDRRLEAAASTTRREWERLQKE
jgi:hypothetical protein